ncbi:MAG: argonaute PAZ domain-containing protein, partial [Thermus sp.]|nr:argonaute PAZ domain-containing protein [Thermus sp.]
MVTAEVKLNRFALGTLPEAQRTPRLLKVFWDPIPGSGENPFSLLGKAAWRLGSHVLPWDGHLLAWTPVRTWGGEMEGAEGVYTFRVEDAGKVLLDPSRPQDRKVLSTRLRRLLQEDLERLGSGEGRWVGWLSLFRKIRQHGDLVEIYRGVSLDIYLDRQGTVVLEVDPRHRIVPLTDLETWLERYPPPRMVRNRYRTESRKRAWRLVQLQPHLRPEEVDVRGVSLLEYHR